MNAEKSGLLSLKETYPYVLREAIKYAKGENSKLKHSLKSLN